MTCVPSTVPSPSTPLTTTAWYGAPTSTTQRGPLSCSQPASRFGMPQAGATSPRPSFLAAGSISLQPYPSERDMPASCTTSSGVLPSSIAIDAAQQLCSVGCATRLTDWCTDTGVASVAAGALACELVCADESAGAADAFASCH